MSTRRPVLYQGRAFYASENDAAGQILCFDGTTEFEFCRLPFGKTPAAQGASMNAIGIAGGYLWASSNDGTTGRLYQISLTTGAATVAGGTFDATAEIVTAIVLYNGILWLATHGINNSNPSHIYSLKVGVATAFTTERTTSDIGGGTGKYRGYTSLLPWSGALYATTSVPAGFNAIIEQRAADGTWSTVKTSGSTNINRYDSLTLFNGAIYSMFNDGTASTFKILTSATGASWSDDHDMAAAGATGTWGFIHAAQSLYASGLGRVFRKPASGAWATVLSDASLTHGMLI